MSESQPIQEILNVDMQDNWETATDEYWVFTERGTRCACRFDGEEYRYTRLMKATVEREHVEAWFYIIDCVG